MRPIVANTAVVRINFGETKPKLILEFNRVGFGVKSIQIGKQFPKIGDTRLATLTLRIC
ncbi:MAG: formate hydrogenlyase subunit 4 [Flammeovirgaceae bacterium]|jgi:formate hydrogenlyase subunit 4